MAHVVTGAAVQITVAGRTHFLEFGSVIPDGVDDETIERLTSEGLIGELVIPEVEDVAPVTYYTQEELDQAVDAAVQVAVGNAEAELEQAREIVTNEATKVAEDKAALDAERLAFEAEKAAPARGARK